jgi:antitoxin component YwqK of YwqJK toxin-antitoxin module
MLEFKNGIYTIVNQWIRRRRFQYQEGYEEGNFLNGYRDGEWKTYSNNLLMSTENYKEGLLHGTINYYSQTWLDRDEQILASACGLTVRRQHVYHLVRSENWSNGKKDGNQFEFNFKGDIVNFEQYKNGVEHGEFEWHDEDGNLIYTIHYKDGMLDGPYYGLADMENSSSGYASLNFTNGKINGPVSLSIHNKIVWKGFAEDGYMSGEWNFYDFDSASYYLISKEIYESADKIIFYRQDVEMRENWILPPEDMHNENAPQVTYFYRSGKIAITGRERGGYEWKDSVKIFNEDSRLVMELYFSGADGGNAQLYYPNGSFKCSGYFKVYEIEYDCEHKISFPFPELKVLEYKSESGEDEVKNGTGYLRFVDLHGVLRYEGMLKSGMETGTWKIYSSGGSLQSIGNFVEGKKEGRWLSGDLTGLHLETNSCFDLNDPIVLEYIKTSSKRLKLKEEVYENGELLYEKEFSVDLNEPIKK